MANTYDITQKLQAIADAIENGGGGGGGGTTVIANPSGTPTADLNTVQIGQVIYDIPGGGGGSGYSETTLWSGAPTTTSITLSDSVLNYDAIYVEAKFNNEAYMVETIDKATFTSYLGNDYISFGTHGGAYYGITPDSTATHFVFFGANYNGCTRVIGLKYASGGGGASSADNVSYDNTQSGLTATNVQDAIDEIDTSVDTLNSNMTWQSVTPTFDLAGSSVSSITVADARANGSQIQVSLAITNNSAKKSGLGNDFNCGKINAPYKPTAISREFGFSYQTTLCVTIDTNGNISARLLSGEWLANYVLSVTLTFPYV